MSSGSDLALYEILLLLKESNFVMSVLYYALNFLMLVKVCLFLICLALLQESSCICAKSNCKTFSTASSGSSSLWSTGNAGDLLGRF